MAEVEKYRTDLEFNADNVPALTRSTLNLADNFNAIYNQLFSNDFKLMDAVTKMAANFGATVLTVLLGSELAAEVAAVTKDSLFFTLLKKALEAAGVAWNFNNSNAWYICFGDLLGGLIIQGGIISYPGNGYNVEWLYPIAFTSRAFGFANPSGRTSYVGAGVTKIECVADTTKCYLNAMQFNADNTIKRPSDGLTCKTIVLGY